MSQIHITVEITFLRTFKMGNFCSQSHTCDISLFRRELPIFCPFLRKSPYENFINSLCILYISLFGNPDLPPKIQKFPSLFNHSPYLEKEISLFVFPSVSHVCSHNSNVFLTFFCRHYLNLCGNSPESSETSWINHPQSMPMVERPEVTCYRICLQL